MITLTAEIICDECNQVVASSQPHPNSEFSYYSSAIYEAEKKARSHGAQITPSRVLCGHCAPKPTTPTVWVIEESNLGPMDFRDKTP